MKLTHEVWKDLAGPLYEELMQSKDGALAHLFNTDRDVRIAAINICASVWNCSTDLDFVNTCRELAATDRDDSVRFHALQVFGNALLSSKDDSASQFLADVATNETNSDQVRTAGYWALRGIQLGVIEEDMIKQSIAVAKLALSNFPSDLTEDQLKQAFLGSGRYSNIDWDLDEQIDWDFVDQYTSQGD